jgi:hypothetical protein
MAKGKKYDFKVTQVDSTWSAEIIRQVTSRKTVVSKSQDGFASESDATEWAKQQLAEFLEQLKQKNKRNSG